MSVNRTRTWTPGPRETGRRGVTRLGGTVVAVLLAAGLAGPGAAQTVAAVAAPAGVSNPFLQGGGNGDTARGGEAGAGVLSPQVCNAVLAQRASGKTLTEKAAELADECLALARRQNQAMVFGAAERATEELRSLVAIGRSGSQVLFLLADMSFRGEIDKATTVSGRELIVRVNGSAIELHVPEAVLREVGIDKPVSVWRGEVGRRSRATLPGTTRGPGPAPVQMR